MYFGNLFEKAECTLATDLHKPTPVMKAFNLVQTITGVDLIALDIAKNEGPEDQLMTIVWN